jgi:hypothetical protein
VYLRIKKGKIRSIFTHLDKFQKERDINEGIIHLKDEESFTIKDFKKSHLKDHN